MNDQNLTPNTPEAQAAREAELLREMNAIPMVLKSYTADGRPCYAPADVDRWNAIQAERKALAAPRAPHPEKDQDVIRPAPMDMESAFKAGFEAGASFHATFHGFDNAAAQDAWMGFKSRLPPSPVMVAGLVEAHKRAMANASEVTK